MSVRARSFSYEVSLDRDWVATSSRGGTAIPNEEEEWTPEHLVLAGLCRCVLTSFRHHARRAGLEPSVGARAEGVVTRRETDGRFAFVEIRVDIDVQVAPAPDPDLVTALVAKGERDCFVGASLAVKPDYRWSVNGESVS